MTSLSSSMKARQSRGNSMVNYSMTLGRMPAEGDEEVHTRTEPFLNDVPGILEDMDHTMAAAKAYRDDLVSDGKGANKWRELWEVVERPTPQYIADRMDIEKEFLTTKPRTGKASRYIRRAAMEPPSAVHQQRRGKGKSQLQRPHGNASARHSVDYTTKWKVEQYVKQPVTPDAPRPRQLRQRMEEMVAAEEEAMMAKAAQADTTDSVGLSLMMLERKQQQTQKYMGNRVSLQQHQQPGTTAMSRRHGTGGSRPSSAAAPGHHGSQRQASAHQQRPQTAYPASGLDISGPGADGGQQGSGGSPPYGGPKSHSYSGYMSQSEAKYEKLISTMHEMGDFTALSEMHDAPPPETSDLQTWVSGFKEKNEQKLQAAAAASAEESTGLFPEASDGGSTISSSQHHQPQHQGSGRAAAKSVFGDIRGKSMLGRLSEEGSASAFGDPAAAEPQDEQTKSLLEFNNVLNFLIGYSTETEKARMDVNSKKTSIYKAAKVARKQQQFPLDLVEQYVDAAKSGIQGLESLDQMLAHVRQQSQVVAEESGIRAGHSGSEMYLPIEVDLQLEILGQVQGDLGKLLEDDESPEDAATEQEPHTPQSSAAGSPKQKPQGGRGFVVPGAGPQRKSRSRQSSMSPRKTQQQQGTGGSGSINRTEVKRLMGWLERIVTKLNKRNAAESTDVMDITEKFRSASEKKLHSLTTNAGATAAATVKDYDPESMSELLYFLLSSVMQLRDGPYRELGSLMSVALQSLVGEIQWLLAMLRANQGANSPHIQMLVAVVRAMHGERLLRSAAEERIKAMASAAEADKTRTKTALSRADELGDKLVAKEKALVLLKGDLAEHQDEVRILRERVKALETEVKVLEGDMTMAGHRALATAQVVKQGVKFQGTLKNANLACKWKLLSQGVQATGNGRADDPNAEVPDIPEPEPLIPEPPLAEASRASRASKKQGAMAAKKPEGKTRSLGKTLGGSRRGAG